MKILQSGWNELIFNLLQESSSFQALDDFKIEGNTDFILK